MPSGAFGACLQSARELWVANDVKSLVMRIHGQMYLGVGGFADYPLAPGGVWVTLQWRPRSSFTRSATPSPALPPTPVIAPATDAPVTVVGDRSRQYAQFPNTVSTKRRLSCSTPPNCVVCAGSRGSSAVQ